MLGLAIVLALASPDSAHHVRLDAESVIVESQWDDTAAPLGVALPPGATRWVSSATAPRPIH